MPREPAHLALTTGIGLAVCRRLTDRQFRWLLVWLLFASGILLALRELG